MTARPRAARALLAAGLLVTLGACGSTKASGAGADLSTRVGKLEKRVDKLESASAPAASTGEATKTAAKSPATSAVAKAGAHGAATTAASHGAPAAHGEAPHWGYADAAHWGELAAEFAPCSAGKQQSPIDLTRAAPVAIEDAKLAYKASAATVVDNGHTVQVNLDDAGTATIDGREYELVQFHFHAPSEHTVDGEHSPVEAHFVHKDADGKLAVIGVMIVQGAGSDPLQAIIDAIPGKGAEAKLPGTVDVSKLLPPYLTAYRYAGSLTTPPCSEGVTWSVLVQPVTWSAAQIAQLTKHFAEPNNRPVQDLHDRDLRVDVAAG
jgi:carbonic anhydrase